MLFIAVPLTLIIVFIFAAVCATPWLAAHADERGLVSLPE